MTTSLFPFSFFENWIRLDLFNGLITFLYIQIFTVGVWGANGKKLVGIGEYEFLKHSYS